MPAAPNATSPTRPKKAVSVTLIIFCANKPKKIGYVICQIRLSKLIKSAFSMTKVQSYSQLAMNSIFLATFAA